MLPILIEVGVTPTSLAVFAPLAPPPPPGPEGPFVFPAAGPPVAPPPVRPPAVPWSPVVPPLADWSPPVASPAPIPVPFELPRPAFTTALLGSLVPHACRTRARIGMTRSSLYRRRAVSSRRRRPPTIPLPVTRFMAPTTLGIRHPTARILARARSRCYPAMAFSRRAS